ncbi:CheY-like superfamily [Penicillium verhagenii]|nr:CheY-like superfamily [Penicillium verhagenii]
MTSQDSYGTGPETSQTSLDNSNQTLSQSHRTGSGSQNDGRVSSTGLSGSDRIYPIRSLVSMNPARWTHASPSPAIEEAEESLNQPEDPPISSIDSLPEAAAPYPNQDIHAVSHNSVSVNDEISSNTPATGDLDHTAESVNPLDTPSEEPADENRPLMTSRFEHAFTENGHTVVTGDGKNAIKRCEDEPIRTPGAIQSFGVMIALREESPNQFVVRVASENSQRVMGYSPQQLFATESFTDILKQDQRAILLEHLDYARDDSCDLIIDGPEVFLLTIEQPSGSPVRFWCATHVSQENKDIVICEFELENDQLNPLNLEDQKLPETPTSTLQTNPPPTEAQYAGSTISASNSVRSIRDARMRKGEAASMQVFGVLSQIQAQLSQVDDQDTLLKVTAGLVKELVGFHRVMVYQFDHKANGRVVAELMDPKVTVDLYQGLHFPASDIPSQARELYKANKVRLLYNRDHITARLVCRTLEDLETPLDMSHAYLRAMSPIHNQYLANMKVRSSMSISINAYDDLWGLISCHSYGEEGMRVSFPIRKLCRLVGDTVARNIERINHASDLQARAMMSSVPKEADPSKYIVGSSDDLLRLFQSDYGVLSIGNEAKLFGGETNSQEVLALVEYIRMRKFTSILTSHDIGQDFPDFVYEPGLKRISGLLCIPIAPNGNDFVIFFRLGQLTTITWAGNPHKPAGGGIGPLTPRQSFKEWREITLSRSKEWSHFDVSTAGVLGSVYGKFIQVWRQKDILKQNSQLTRLLLANSAHEFRTPLNAVINYLEIAMEGTLDGETRESLVRSYTASKSLVYIVNDLLDLATESGQQLIKNESFKLKPTLHEAFDLLAGEAKRKGIAYNFKMNPGIPDAVLGDERRIRQIIVNLISNAIENTSKGGVTIEVSTSDVESDLVSVEMSVIDTGSGMSKQTLECLFQELEEVYADKHWAGEEDANNFHGQKQRVLGTGLALTARIVHTMQGQLIVKSKEGQGSRFKVLLQFSIPGESSPLPLQNSNASNLLEMPKSPSLLDGEFILVKNRKDGTLQSSEHNSTGDYLGHGQTGTNVVKSLQPQKSLPESEIQTDQKQEAPFYLLKRADASSQQSHSTTPGVQKMSSQVDSQDTSNIPTPNTSSSPSNDTKMNILVAEDNPVNSKILEKRLSKLGHTVQLTSNGEACVKAFASEGDRIHAILMDIQMPIVDGMTATKMIREIESRRNECSDADKSDRPNRIPIFAVSASIVERDERSYIDIGFDGWIMKPIDFARLKILLGGVLDPEAREDPVGERDWEKGGWFHFE